MRKILHIDMDAFYASVEQRDDPSLRGRPVVVAWRGARSVVVAASYEARPFGIHSAMPAVRAERLCPDAIFVPPDFVRYKAASKQIREIFLRHTDLVEPLSLDEAYLDVTAPKIMSPSATATASAIRAQIFDVTRLTASAGIAPNKFLAKVASDWNKPNGQCVVSPSKIDAFLLPLAVGRIPGVGKVMQLKLAGLGIATVADLRSLSLEELDARFGRFGRRLYERARGIDERPVQARQDAQSISAEDTFETDLPLDELEPAIRRLAEKSWLATRKTRRVGHTVVLKLKTAQFRILTRSFTPESRPTTLDDFTAIALALRERVDLPSSTRYRLAGVGLSGFRDRDERAEQAPLFGAARTDTFDANPATDPFMSPSGNSRMTFRYQLVLFDLDGTLVDSAPDIAEAVNRTLVEWNLPRVDETTIRGWIGDGARTLVETAFRSAGSDVDTDSVMPNFMVHYADCLLLQAQLYPGVRETLDGLHARGVRIALCTNKPDRFIAPLLEHLGIAQCFDAVVGADTLPEKKPSALPLLHLARELGHAVDACLMVGDSMTDLHAAQAAAMDVVMVSYGYARGVDLHAEGVRVVDDLRELLAAERSSL